MREYVSGLFLILDSRRFTSDIVFDAISPYEGQQTIVVKNGNNGTSQRGRVLDLGNAVKTKMYKRHHYYLTEADIVESFSFLKSSLSTIVLFQILLIVLKRSYFLPERNFFFSIYKTLLELNESKDEERAELGLFLLIMKILNHYQLLEFPINCQVCTENIYQGNYDYLGFYCHKHLAAKGTSFSLFNTHDRVEFLKTFLKELLNINVTFNPE